MNRIMRALHIHWNRFHHREGANVYTQCRCGKREWHCTGQGYSPVNKVPPPPIDDGNDRLKALVKEWNHRASTALRCAERTNDCPMGQRLVEHGAVCYANCAAELEAVLNSNKEGKA